MCVKEKQTFDAGTRVSRNDAMTDKRQLNLPRMTRPTNKLKVTVTNVENFCNEKSIKINQD